MTIEISHDDYQRLANAPKITTEDYEKRRFEGYIYKIFVARQALGMSSQPEFILSDYDPEKWKEQMWIPGNMSI